MNDITDPADSTGSVPAATEEQMRVEAWKENSNDWQRLAEGLQIAHAWLKANRKQQQATIERLEKCVATFVAVGAEVDRHAREYQATIVRLERVREALDAVVYEEDGVFYIKGEAVLLVDGGQRRSRWQTGRINEEHVRAVLTESEGGK